MSGAIAGFAGGVVAGLGVALPLGAIGALLIRLPASAGTRSAVGAALGVATTDGVYAAVAVLGGRTIAGHLTRVATPLAVASALVLAALAVGTLVRARRAADAQPGGWLTPLRAYVGLLLLTAVNPATLAYFLALVVGLAARPSAWFVVGVFVASAAWQLTLVGGGAALSHRLTSGRGRTGLAIVSAGVMLAAAGRAVAGAV